MKIYIGPYTTWWGPYQIADLLQYIGVSSERCDRIGDWLADTWVNDLCTWFHKKYGERKAIIRIDNYDTWSLDYTLAQIIHPALIKFRDGRHGTHYTDIEDAPHIPDDEDVGHGHMAGFSEARWTYILDEMIYAFSLSLNEDWDTEIYEKHGNTWSKEAMDERKKIEERAANGRRLFAKYYNGLWD